MIISKLQGGMANQIFQWAYGKYLSETYKTPLYLDTVFFQNQYGITQRKFSLNKFANLDYKIIPSDRNISNLSNEIDKTKIIKLTDNSTFFEINYDHSAHYYLDGYWQSEKYFFDISDIIRAELQPNEDIRSNLFKVYNPQNNVSIHIRRTDYLTSNGYHPVQTIEYYTNALDIIGSVDKILIFSDDIEWCKENLRYHNMIFVEGLSDVEDLWLMSMCDHNIIANSSFSWWGAWLNQNPKKKIVAPKLWLKDNKLAKEIVPDHWYKI